MSQPEVDAERCHISAASERRWLSLSQHRRNSCKALRHDIRVGPGSKAGGPSRLTVPWVVFEPIRKCAKLPNSHTLDAALGPVSCEKRGKIVMKLNVVLEDESAFKRPRIRQVIYHA